MNGPDSVPWATRWAYALPAAALAIVGIPLYVYIPKFYTDVVGVDIALVGFVLLAVRMFDAVSDPVIGALSDRTRSIMGRRRPWVLFGIFPLTLALVMLFAPPEGLSTVGATVWFGLLVFLVFFGWTLVTVPYESLGPELSQDYNERTSVLGLRDGLLILGTILAAASPAIVAALTGFGEGDRETWLIVALAYAPVLVASVVVCVWVVRERPAGARTRPTTNPLQGFYRLTGNRPFLILLASYTVASIGASLPATLITFYVSYVIGDPAAAGYLLLYFATGVILLPGWIWFARRVGKKPAWIVAVLANTLTFAGVFLLGAGDSFAFSILVVLSGTAFGATLAIPSAMQADVIDYEELRSGSRREGEIIGVWAVCRKLAAAAGVGAALPILAAVGYVEGAAEQPDSVVFALRALYALVPSLFNLAGLLIALWYPIDQRTHEAILAAIVERKQGREWVDPISGRRGTA